MSKAQASKRSLAEVTRDWLAEIVPGRSFVDIGGLWNTVNERVTVAAQAGAASLTMADFQPKDSHWWPKFRERCAERGVSDVREVTADVMAPDVAQVIGRHDVVHCSGVMYHVPDPVLFIRHLRDLSNDYVILGSMAIPATIKTNAGTLEFEGGECLFAPALDERQTSILQEFFQDLRWETMIVDDWVKPDGSIRYGPYWWFMTPAFIHRMIEAVGLTVLDDAPAVRGRSHAWLCRKPG